MRRTWKTNAAILSAVAAVAGTSLPGVVKAATAQWNAASGDYSTAIDWTGATGGGVPAAADTADVNNGGLVTYTTGDTYSVAQLWFGDSSVPTTFNNGNGAQTGGVLTVTNTFALGHGGLSTGTYNFSAGTLNVTGITRVFGNVVADPTGVATALNISGTAVMNDSSTLDVGYNNGTNTGAATLNMSGGTLNQTGGAFTVANGTNTVGTVYLSGGTINATTTTVGNGTNANGKFFLGTGGAFKGNNTFTVATGTNAVGNLNISGGSFTNSGDIHIGEGGGATGTVVMNSGTLTETGQIWIADANSANNKTGGTGTFILNGGTVTSSNWAVIGRGGSTTGVLTINDGSFTHNASGSNAFEVGSYGGNNGTANNSTLNLNGGLLTTDYIEDESPASTVANPGAQTINFNGGVLQTNDNDGGFLGGHDPNAGAGVAPILNVGNGTGNGGAIFNTSTFTIGVTLPLVHSTLAGTNPTDGGLTKYGTGTLNLSSGSTYNGPTTINAGTLNILSTASSNSSSIAVNAATLNLLGSAVGNISVNAGSTIGSYNASGAGGSTTGSLTFAGTSTLLVNPTGTQFLTVGGAVTATGASVLVVPTITTASTSPEEILYAKGGITGTLGGPGSGANFTPGIRGTLTEAPDPSSVGTDLFITAATAGPANLVWTGTNATHPTYWDVQTTPNWYNTGSASTDEFYAGDNVTFDDTGTTTNIAIQGVSVTPTSVTFNNFNKSYSFTGGGIAGSGSLSINGGGTVTLNQSNSYTGATNINSGTLVLGTGSGLSLSTPISLGNGTSTGVLKLGDATSAVSITAASLTVVGTGTGNELIGGNANTSTLTVTNSVLLGTPSLPTSYLTLGAGANLVGNAGSNPSLGIGPAAGDTGTLNVLTGATYTSNSDDIWVGNGSGGVGTLNISGGTVISNGWIAPGRAGGTGTINLTGGSLIKTTSNGNLDIAGDGAGSHGYLYQTGGTVTTTTFVVLGENNSSEVGVWNISGGTSTASVASVIVGSSGNGTLNIFGGSSFTSLGTSIVGQNGGSVGTLSITGATDSTNGLTASYSAAVTVGSGGILNIPNGGPDTAIASGSGTNATLNLLAGGTFNAGTGQVFIGDNTGVGVFNVSGAVTVNNYLAVGRTGGNGIMNLTPTGSITVLNNSNGSTIIGGDGGGKGSVGNFIQTGGTFSSPTNGLVLGEQNGTALDSGTWNFSGGTANLNSPILTGTVAVNTGTTGLTIGSAGNGTVNISGTAQLNAGNVIIANSTGSTGVLNVSGGTSTVRSIDLGLGGAGTVNLTNGTLNSTSVTLGNNATATSTLNLSGGTLTTTAIAGGNSTAAPAININGGILQASNSTTTLISLPAGQAVQIQSLGATIDSQSYDVGIPSTLAGTGALNKIGTGNLRLSASNSYTGNTTVSAGTLTVANANALSTGTVSLANHATLALAAAPSSIAFTNYLPNAQTTVFTPVVSASQTAVTLTTTTNSDAVSIFDQNFTTINDATGFAASFTYNHATSGPEQTGADGVVFVLQSGNGSPNSAAGAGGSIAYNGGPGFSSSLAAAVDLFLDRLDLGMGNGSNGALTFTPENSSPEISQSTTGNVTIVYNGATQTLTETYTASNGVSTSNSSTGIDAAAQLGGTAGGTAFAYLGFTASTGGVNDVQTISDFKFNANGTTIPANSNAAIAITNSVIVASTAASPASSTIQLAPTANFSSGAVGPIMIQTAGTLAISIGANAATGVTHGVLTTSSITFANSSSGKLDVASNALDITGQSLGTINQLVASAFTKGAWTGPGIGSSVAAANASHLTALGVILNSVDGTSTGAALYGSATTLGLFEGISPASTDVLVKYTYYGDANLDGKVDATDYSRIDANYASGGTLTGWYNGDFNYDGVVNGSDYTLIDNAFNTQGASLASAISSPLASATAQIAGASSSVPEPTTLGLLAIGAAGLLGRRRRHNSTRLAGAH